MTLKELSAQYKTAAIPIRESLRELRTKLVDADDPEEKWHLKRRIVELTPMLTQLNELAWLLEHYYEKGGGVRDDRYGFNGKRKPPRKRKADERVDPDTKRRIDRLTAADLLGLSPSEEDDSANCGGAEGSQKHGEQDTETCGKESTALFEILPDVDVSAFFPQNPKRNRRMK